MENKQATTLESLGQDEFTQVELAAVDQDVVAADASSAGVFNIFDQTVPGTTRSALAGPLWI